MKGVNMIFVPMILVVLALIGFFVNAIAFDEAEKAVLWAVGFIVTAAFLYFAFK